MKNKFIICLIFSIFASGLLLRSATGQPIGNGLEIDKTVHDFGDIMLDSGPVSCTFTVTNKSDKPAVIYNVSSSCGCTNVKWTREPIRPGSKGTISATYSNDEGPYPFDKSLTVYFSGIKKPVILKLRGHSMAKQLTLEERYQERFGAIGIKETVIKAGNLEQGGVRSGTVKIANLSGSPVTVSFSETTPELSLSVSPNPIPARTTANLDFTIKASRQKWGKNFYRTSVIANGKRQDGELTFWGYTKENFDNLTKEQKAAGARPMFENSTYSFGKAKQGTIVHAEYKFKNTGKSEFKVYKIDVDSGKASPKGIPTAGPGESSIFSIDLDTSTMPKGEALAVVTLTTNSPLRPIINLFIAGWLE